jgi:hypothetical protein
MPNTRYPLDDNYEYYFSNYGGPSYKDEQYYHSQNAYIPELIKSNNQMYKIPLSEANYTINGVHATVFTTGIHRSVLLSIPKICSDETRQLFLHAKETADKFNGQDYTLLDHNCVQCTSTVLRALAPNDPNLPPLTVSMPWRLDSHLKKYCGSYKDNTINEFTKAYQEKINQEWFSFARSRSFAGGKKQIDSVQEIIKHATGDSPKSSGERTKSVLKKMEWVTEDATGILRPGKNAPEDFKKELTAYYKNYDEALHKTDTRQNSINYKSRFQRFIDAVKSLVSTENHDEQKANNTDANHPRL